MYIIMNFKKVKRRFLAKEKILVPMSFYFFLLLLFLFGFLSTSFIIKKMISKDDIKDFKDYINKSSNTVSYTHLTLPTTVSV